MARCILTCCKAWSHCHTATFSVQGWSSLVTLSHCHSFCTGVEQASHSVPLQDYRFPTSCVLLLGNEQSGVPVRLMPLLDGCCEIPMLGVTRSLNAHVSGALMVWAYATQHVLGKKPACG